MMFLSGMNSRADLKYDYLRCFHNNKLRIKYSFMMIDTLHNNTPELVFKDIEFNRILLI